MTYIPNPLYFIDFGRANQRAKLYNYFTVLKKEAREIFTEWSNNAFLKSKSKGEIIYLTDRNFTAHGASENMANGICNMIMTKIICILIM